VFFCGAYPITTAATESLDEGRGIAGLIAGDGGKKIGRAMTICNKEEHSKLPWNQLLARREPLNGKRGKSGGGGNHKKKRKNERTKNL